MPDCSTTPVMSPIVSSATVSAANPVTTIGASASFRCGANNSASLDTTDRELSAAATISGVIANDR